VGITFVEKSDLSHPKRNPKLALVLAGGAISGGAFKIGGLIALNAFLTNRKVTDFDIYVGTSAGAFLAAPLSSGISPEELLRSIEGQSARIRQFKPTDFYLPNWREFISRPAKLVRDAATFLPSVSGAFARFVLEHRGEVITLARRFLRDPSYQNAERLLGPIFRETSRATDLRSGLSYMPSGIFDNANIERFIRDNLRRNHVPNNFRLMWLERGKSLYIAAMNLNTAQGVVFGHDEDNSATISEAVQASTAIPGFYKPARINGQDYLDAGIRKTANISHAVRKGADLVIVYNPFRPFVNYYADQLLNNQRSIADMGLFAVINQAFRTMLHTRLKLGIEALAFDPAFKGDLIVIEPTETDAKFFNMNPLAFWQRAVAAEHGFASVKESIERHQARITRVLRAYGIQTDLQGLRESLQAIRRANYDEGTIMEVLREAGSSAAEGAGSEAGQRRVPLRVVR